VDTKSKKIFFYKSTPFSDGIKIYYSEDIWDRRKNWNG
jgi:hypothetical protein